MSIEPVGGKIGWLLAALFCACLMGCSTFEPLPPERGRDSAWIKITYTDKPIMHQGKQSSGLARCVRPGVCEVILRADQYPYGCLNHEVVHVFSKQFHFHSQDVPNGDYCLN